MITRHLAPRQCRRLLFSHQARRQWARTLASEPSSPSPLDSNDANAAAAQYFHQHSLNQSSAPSQDAAASDPDALTSDRPTSTDPAYEAVARAETARYTKLSDYHTWNHLIHNQHTVGSVVEPHYQPRDLLSNPPSASDITLELLMASQAHLGHSTSLWNPANSKYIFGIRQGIHIISLDVTAAYLRRAAKVVAGVAQKGGLILFAGTRKGQARVVVRAAELSSPAYHLFSRWLPGTITNGAQILGGALMKVVDEHDNEVDGFAEQLQKLPVRKPDLVICLNPKENYVLLHECGLAGIPTVGILDTDCDPSWVTYPIPANDDSLRCVTVIGGILGRAGQQGQSARRELAKQGKVPYKLPKELGVPDEASKGGKAQDMFELRRQIGAGEEGEDPGHAIEVTEQETNSARAAKRDDEMLQQTHPDAR